MSEGWAESDSDTFLREAFFSSQNWNNSREHLSSRADSDRGTVPELLKGMQINYEVRTNPVWSKIHL